ncbi:outer membrane receptor protein involved in Fe transport [Pontibacter ummariensis]|uniref:Outer membrane receptor proteins, mostly Fe transport n=1 Tax=Pontibacter ummariensis TaxID=1610492 RepID=A0A239L6E5_9BACT|nr:outer membrane beta-barrel family protein [Pontibacter ummariensis]PRY04269.1 outer membrane receptor protein involved in Fe transport [Pontibacter ummariensis]SNT25488.1 Outer membrane receptor proteins, mostly Fe transport [Pontibacter ummariensis]
MKRFLFLIILTLSVLSHEAIAQGILSGAVKDGQGQPLGFVNVAVLKASDEAVMTGTIADMEGGFQIVTPVAGKYKLKLSMVGYTSTETAPFDVTSSNFSKDFGTFSLSEDAKMLREVTVQAMRPTVISHADKMVVNVEGTAMAAGATAFEVLTKSPGVWVDQDGNIKLNGKAGVQIMIDGRKAYLTGKELQNLLQSMSADNMKDLEIVTNPSAKYEAEGASGIININLKKNTAGGMNGSVHAGYQYSELHGYTAGTDLNYKQGKWSSFVNLDVAERTNYRTNDMQRIYLEKQGLKLSQYVVEKGTRFIPALRFGTDYSLNSKHSVGFLANASFYNTEGRINTNAYLRGSQPENDLYIKADNHAETEYDNTTFNLHYLGRLDSLGTTLSADLDYVRLASKDESRFLNKYDSLGNNSPVMIDLLTTENPSNYDIYAARADFTKPLGKGRKLELGAKASRVVSDNELKFYQSTDGKKVLDNSRSNHFIYKENIYAAYANFSASLSDKWNLQGGLRAEQTITNGKSETLDERTKKSYLDLFPSLFLQQNVNENYQISYSYSRRISRPRYSALNPFVFYLDPYSVVLGNPGLKPQYTHSFTVTQTLQQRYNMVLDYAVTKDYIIEVPAKTSSDEVTLFQQQNVDDMQSASATLVAPVRVSARWEMNNSATVLYQDFAQRRGDQVLKNEQATFIAQSNHNVQLPAGVRMEVNAGYRGPVAYGLYELHSNWWVDAGLKRSFLSDKLDLSLNVTDIFRSKKIEGVTQVEGYAISAEQYQGTQSFRFNLRYRFNKGEKVDTKKRNVNLDEVNRAGGS